MKISSFSNLNSSISAGNVHFGNSSSAQTELATLLSCLRNHKNIIVVPSNKEVSKWANFFDAHSELLDQENYKISILPYISFWGSDRYVNPSLSKRQRLYALSLAANSNQKAIFLTTLPALGQMTVPIERFNDSTITISKDEILDSDNFESLVQQAGYKPSFLVEQEGTYSIKGSIFDIFAPNHSNPIRLEFLGDSIQSIRFYDPESQKSTKSVESVSITPANESLILKNEFKECQQRLYETLIDDFTIKTEDRDGIMDSFNRGISNLSLEVAYPVILKQTSASLSYFDTESNLIFPNTIQACNVSYKQFLDDAIESFDRDRKEKRFSISPLQHFAERSLIESFLSSCRSKVEFGFPKSEFIANSLAFDAENPFKNISEIHNASNRFDQWIIAIKNLVELENGTIVTISPTKDHQSRLQSLLQHRELSSINTTIADILKSTKAEKNIHILSVMGEFSNFVWFDQEKLLFIPEHSLFGIQEKTRKPRSRTLKNYLSSFRDLKTGDLVVHTQHGIGMYRGMVGMTVAGFSGDFLHLEYAGGDKIFLPADKLNLLQRYNSGSDSNAGQSHLDRLGSGGWERKKAKASQAIKDMAEKLLKLQAQRTLAPIHVYTSPSDDYFKFEAEFPFTETDDQLKAIQDVNSDLQSGKPMDRLICGDVGFGKTEVALRAIYRAVQEGFQVLVLVPTTILCYQHFRNFTDRLSKHGIRVAQLNRFVPSKAAKIVLEDMASGRIDVLVGTHKILGTKIAVKRLGMIVVDEEQRFGVTHKERLKELRAGADILTLTATPIPRTLHMAMLGLRDISIIATPPVSRVSVKTYIAEHDESLIKDAIEREISRNGQVFYVHNRVDDIAETTNYVKSLVPTARIKFAHGQMKETDLEDVILEFIEQRFDVLVCTTIIESGVDMPNVNTLIIDNSERFGLAQLYQMRGRVGRSSVQAFAYFLTNRISRLTDDAQKRLDVLASHQELGAGFQIASHDLEIRGAGNLLGADQSGHAAEVGLEMYTDLLAEAIAELRNENPPKKPTDPEIRLPISASILGSYIPTEGLRLQLYKNLFSSNSISSVDNLFNEALDRYGIMPVLTKKLFSIARIKTYLTSMNATQLIFISTQNVLEIRFTNLKELQIQHLIVEVQRQSKLLRLSPDYKLYINAASMQFWDLSNDDSQLKSLEKLNELLGNLCTHQEQI